MGGNYGDIGLGDYNLPTTNSDFITIEAAPGQTKEGKDEMTKASIDLQDLRRRICVKAKAERSHNP